MTSATDQGRERQLLFRAALAVMRRSGYASANVTDILAEANLGTRAFYRHFQSKDELLVALFHDNAESTRRRLEERVRSASTPAEQLEAWIDEMLDMSYDPRRSGRARVFTSEAARVAFGGAGDVAAAELYAPLQRVLVDGAADGAFPGCDPAADAASIHALVWRFFWAAVHGRPELDRESARAHILRFVLPAIGANGPD